ncbi:hypothetical protein SPI_03945 [Niveomyces insectorum RCEF 264]|uniref:Uncharacterized protein n=1 Tax=Niveomyces insectorum RCEF 264 TaxID=1081102 RepID=A0A167VAL8_9HYPO|nr:hypothetical protein SPI_03945 [Niveomyces insectorum RCEF 264]
METTEQQRQSPKTNARSGSVHAAKKPPSSDPSPNHARVDAVQVPGARRQEPAGTASWNQSMPGLPEESTIRAQQSFPRINPFYTVISDTTSSSTSPRAYYPRVRYVFSDDDPDLLSGALAARDASVSERFNLVGGGAVATAVRGAPHPGERDGPAHLLGPDRSILLDLAPKHDGRGYEVASARSLSTDWAVTAAYLNHLDASSSDTVSDGEGRPLILNIEGVGMSTGAASPVGAQVARTRGETATATATATSPTSKSGSSSDFDVRNTRPPTENYQDLIHIFEKRLSLLRKVVQNLETSERHPSLADPDPKHEDRLQHIRKDGPFQGPNK